MANGKRGPTTGTEATKRGGQAKRDQYGSDFYQAIGQKSGAATKQKYGADQYRRIGQFGGKNRQRPQQLDQAAPAESDQVPGV